MKKRVMALLVLLFFLFLGVEANGVDTIRYERNNQEENLSEDVIGQAMLAYQEFLEGRITVVMENCLPKYSLAADSTVGAVRDAFSLTI